MRLPVEGRTGAAGLNREAQSARCVTRASRDTLGSWRCVTVTYRRECLVYVRLGAYRAAKLIYNDLDRNKSRLWSREHYTPGIARVHNAWRQWHILENAGNTREGFKLSLSLSPSFHLSFSLSLYIYMYIWIQFAKVLTARYKPRVRSFVQAYNVARKYLDALLHLYRSRVTYENVRSLCLILYKLH